MASTEVGSIHYELDLDQKKFDSGIKHASSRMEKFKGQIERSTEASKEFTKFFLAGTAAAAAAVVGFGKKSVDAYNEATEAAAKLETNLLAVKGNTLDNVEALKRQASALQAVGVIGDDVIIAGQSQLATFGLQGETIEKVTPKILDMITQLKGFNATSEDAANINNLVGKVLTGNIGALSRYGVTLTETQEKQLKNGTEAQRAALLVEVLGQNYGNVNEALRNTFQGQMVAANNTIGDFMELVGQMITQYLTPLVTKFNEWAASMGGPEGIMKALNERLNQMAEFIKNNQPLIIGIAGAIAGPLVVAFTSWAIAAAAAALSTALALAPVMLLGAGVALLAFTIIKNWDKIKGAFGDGKRFIENIMNRINDFLKSAGEKAKGFLNKLNPFHRESPSLVDNIRRGVGVIQNEFSKLDTVGIDIPSVASVGAPLADTSSAGRMASPVINIDVGMFAGTPQELRTFAEKLNLEMSRLNTARGM